MHFLESNVWISIKISLKLLPNGPIYDISALVQIMAWHRPGNKSLSEPMMVNLLTHICVTWFQWDNSQWLCWHWSHIIEVLAYYSIFTGTLHLNTPGATRFFRISSALKCHQLVKMSQNHWMPMWLVKQHILLGARTSTHTVMAKFKGFKYRGWIASISVTEILMLWVDVAYS